MHDRLTKADRYREEALRCHEMSKYADPPFLGDFYRRIAVRYMFMAEEISNEARAQRDPTPQSTAIGGRSRQA